MKRALLLIFILLAVSIVNAAEVCVVVDYGDEKEDNGAPDSKCITVDEGKNGFDLMQLTNWDLLWGPETAFGHMLCKINDIGTEVSGNFCEYSGEFWNIVLVREGKWLHMPVGLDGPGGCWNYDINSWNGHYCTNNKDVLAFAFGEAGAEPNMFDANVSRVDVDGKKETKITPSGGKIRNAFPGSKIEFKMEFENLYDSTTEIDIKDISVIGTLEEIDDGSDIEEEIDEFDLSADRKTTKTLEFIIPWEVEAKDKHLLLEIKAIDDAGIVYEKEFGYDVEIEKENHKLKMLKAELDKTAYECGRQALLDLSMLNIGSNDEDVTVKITNRELNLNIEKDFKLTNDAFEPSNRYEDKLSFFLPENINKKEYILTINAEYGSKKETETLKLAVDKCDFEGIIDQEEGTMEEKTATETEGSMGEQEQTSAAKETKTTAETKSIKEPIYKNTKVVLTSVLGLLVVVIIILMLIFLFVRRKAP